MGYKIKSPVERWAGEVVLCDPLTLEQVIAIEDALDAGVDLKDSEFLKSLASSAEGKASLRWSSRMDAVFLPVIAKCIKSHTLPIDFDNYPATPRQDSHTLILILWDALIKIYRGTVDVPNE